MQPVKRVKDVAGPSTIIDMNVITVFVSSKHVNTTSMH